MIFKLRHYPLFRTIILAATLAIAVYNTTVRADPGPIGNWLMNEPLSLFDWGMYKVSKDTEYASDRLKNEHSLALAIGWTHYDWDNNEILIIMHLSSEGLYHATHDNCNFFRQRLLESLTFYIKDPKTDPKVDYSEFATIAVGSWFSHNGFESGNRPEDLGKKLARIVWVEVNYTDVGEGSISCKARITEWDAPSLPG